MIKNEYLAEKHTGMRISAKGVLLRVSGDLSGSAKEMCGHLTEMAERFYAGEISVVDEFLQLYCLDEKRPTENEPESWL
jgi:hypothetical protein